MRRVRGAGCGVRVVGIAAIVLWTGCACDEFMWLARDQGLHRD